MILAKSSLQILLCLAAIACCMSARTGRKGIKKTSLSNHLARRMIAAIPKHISDRLYVKAEPTTEKPTTQEIGNCDNEAELSNYFFNVYSENTTYYQNTLNPREFENLVKFQLQRGEREENREAKAEIFKCQNREDNKCFQAAEIFDKIGATELNYTNFKDACPYLLFNNEFEECDFDDPEASEKLDPVLTWIVGMIFAGIVSLWSWNGLVVFPVITSKVYKRVLCFMIALAFSCMSTNGLLNYVALADGFFEADLDNTNGSYFYKHLMMLAVIFAFFCFERSMKLFAIWKTKKRRVKEEMARRLRKASRIYDLDELEDEIEDKFEVEEEKRILQQRMLQRGLSINVVDINILGNAGTITLEDTSKFEDDINKNTKLCCTSLTEGIANVKPIGWMAIFGDGLGNFMDGLSIGASINQGITPGLTTAIATWCSNIPQELGDFALLSRAGMTPFQALFYNYLSGNTAYIGCAIGIYFGSNIQSARWIFSISAGTTLFLSLGVLLPEINEEFENSKESLKEKVKITLVQISGMLIGYFIVIMLNAYEDAIQIG